MRGHLQERGPNTWRLSVCVGRDAHTNRKRYAQRTFRGRERQAQRALARLVTEVDEGRHAASSPGTFGELLDRCFATYLPVLAATGCRRSEALALGWGDIGWKASELTIARALTTAADGILEKDTKTHQVRRLTLDRGTVSSLRAYRKLADKRVRECQAHVDEGGFVFSSDLEGQRPWRPDVVTNRFGRLCRTAGIEGVRLHDLRHYVATNLGAAGTPLATICARLGHRDKATTLNVYQHALPVHDHKAADLLGSLLDPADKPSVAS